MTQRVKGKGVDKSERSGMATHDMHSTTLSKPLWCTEWHEYDQCTTKKTARVMGWMRVLRVWREEEQWLKLQDQRCLHGIGCDTMGSCWTQ